MLLFSLLSAVISISSLSLYLPKLSINYSAFITKSKIIQKGDKEIRIKLIKLEFVLKETLIASHFKSIKGKSPLRQAQCIALIPLYKGGNSLAIRGILPFFNCHDFQVVDGK
jgi:hypothetical protein